MDNQIIEEVISHKHLVVYLTNDCSWHKHIDYVKENAWILINMMRRSKFRLNRKSLENKCIYFIFIRPLLKYADEIWNNCTYYEKLELDKIQWEVAWIAYGARNLYLFTFIMKKSDGKVWISNVKLQVFASLLNVQQLITFISLFFNSAYCRHSIYIQP